MMRQQILDVLRRARNRAGALIPRAGAYGAAAEDLSSAPQATGKVTFQCNICAAHATVERSALTREQPSCPGCGSTVRMRSIIHLVSQHLLNRSIPLPDWPHRPEVRGVGLTDWDGYARRLAKRCSYTNTFYHREPRLDICEVRPEQKSSADFLISSDVFEHVLPPVGRAFAGAYELLRPGGFMVLTVPFTLEGLTIEHFPELHEFEVVQTGGRYELHNTTRDGEKQRFSELVFHGGPGETLEMRVFSLPSLIQDLSGAGFVEIELCGESHLPYGIRWESPWSVPLVASKPSA